MRHLHSTPPFVALPDARAQSAKPPPAPLLAAAVHAQSEGVLIAARRWTKNGLRILFANESFCAMTGYTGAELRERGHGFLHENKRDLNSLHRWQTKLKPGSTLSGEGFLTRKDGARVYSSWSYCPVSDQRGRVTHIVATYRDLTDKRRLQEALVNSQRLDAVGRLAGGVAHDFNNLLSVINGYCEMMASNRAVRNHAGRELSEIHVAAEKAAHLVGQLLAFSRRQPGNPRIVNIDQLLRDNTDILCRLLRPARKLEFVLNAGDACVRIDPAQIQQVLLNLVLNARDAVKEGGRVVVSTEVRETIPDGVESGNRRKFAVLTVCDNGTGMTDEVRSRLFEPFFTTKENGRGTGLGLALVYGVVQQAGGFIRVTSAPGKGSTFDVFLPLATRSSRSRRKRIPSLPVTRGQERVLLIEEDAALGNMMAEVFRSGGYAVVATHSTQEALEILRTTPDRFALIVAQAAAKHTPTDEIFAQALHLANPDVRILATGQTDPALFANVNPTNLGTLPKPFSLSALLKAARRLLDTGKLHPHD